jgi:GAF domain-containing protein
MSREALLVRMLVELADTLVDDFDVVEALTRLADRCVELFDISAAGVMLVSPEGDLRVVASSSEAMRVVELFELQAQEGPCPECFHTGQPVIDTDLASGEHHWPAFAPVAIEAGFRSVHAVPMRLRGEPVGALNLFGAEAGGLDEADALAGRALADVATIAVVQHRATRHAQVVTEQLNHALNSRVLIEQAKGVLTERTGLDMDRAFSHLRGYARSHNLLLSDVAQSVIDGRLDIAAFPSSPPGRT